MAWLRRNLEVVLFLTGLGMMIYLAGMGAGRVGLFPWPMINSALASFAAASSGLIS